MKTYLYFFSCIFLILSACNLKENNSSGIKFIQVKYYNYSFNSSLPIPCDEIRSSTGGVDDEFSVIFENKNDNIYGIIDTIITDNSILNNIECELTRLQRDSITNDMDARISCVIHYKNDKVEYLCIGGYLADYMIFNNESVNNNRLLYLIKKNIGYYNWMDSEVLKHSRELSDPRSAYALPASY